MKFLNKQMLDYVYLLIISLITLIIWLPLTTLILRGEAYTYMIKQFYLPLYTDTLRAFANFDVQAMLFGSLFSKIIGLNMPLYFWVEIFSILVINACVFLLVKTLTKNSTTGFIASFIFAAYFFGNEFFAINYYATFVQRIIINVPLLLISFLFLHRFLEKRKRKHYTISISLFFLSMFLAHFGMFLAPPIILYPIFWEMLASFRFRSLFRGLLISLPYIIIVTVFLFLQQSFGENYILKNNIIDFLIYPNKSRYIEGVARQLVYMSQYPTVISALLDRRYPLAYSGTTSTYKFVIPILFTYGISFFLVWTKERKQRTLLLTVTVSLFLMLLTNIYFNRFDVFNTAAANRYYYYPSFLFAIFWALVLVALFSKRGVLIIMGILLGYFLINAALFRWYFTNVKRNAKPTIRLYEYILKNSDQLSPNSLIIVGPTPNFDYYQTLFLTEQLGEKQNTIFHTENVAYFDWRPLAVKANTVITLLYDKTCGCVQKQILKAQ